MDMVYEHKYILVVLCRQVVYYLKVCLHYTNVKPFKIVFKPVQCKTTLMHIDSVHAAIFTCNETSLYLRAPCDKHMLEIMCDSMTICVLHLLGPQCRQELCLLHKPVVAISLSTRV